MSGLSFFTLDKKFELKLFLVGQKVIRFTKSIVFDYYFTYLQCTLYRIY